MSLPRPRLLASDQLARIRDTAIAIATQQGLAVRHEEALQAAARARMRVESGRVFPGRDAVAELTAPGLWAADVQEEEPEAAITLRTCQYPSHVHDLESDRIVPLTEERLIEAAKLVDSLGCWGVVGASPGCPRWVPSDLQPILQYRLQATYCRHGHAPVDPRWPRALPYIMDMAEVLGHPLRSLTVHVVSPLTLGSESMMSLMASRRRLARVHVGNMSSVGATAPVRLSHALAAGLAEVLAAAAVIRAVTELPVSWSISLVPFDLRGMAISYGGPEMLLFRWACEEVNASIGGGTLGAPAGIIRTQAKLPGSQAAAEKMSVLVAGALMGTREFSGAGTLSLDEVFSGEQIILDCEMRDQVQRLVAGVDGDCEPATCLAEVASGLEEGFVQLDSTLSEYRSVYWLPHLWERRALGAWEGAGSPDLRARAKEMAREYVKKHDYHLDPALATELARIYAKAEREFGSS